MFATKGWKRFSYDPAIAAWAQEALIQAKAVVEQPEMRKKWLQCQGTWFVGVDALASDGQGALGGVPLAGRVIDWLSEMDYFPFHPAQLSVIYPGYPNPDKVRPRPVLDTAKTVMRRMWTGFWPWGQTAAVCSKNRMRLF